uniref:Uncharacterized protein n=1 Tax=Panagrolaimus sp. ES5 TaxID=591445 RepID=A0AC34F3I3_9BILA
MLRWSLIFILGFFVASIQCNNIETLNFFVARNEFEYMKIAANGAEVPTKRTDNILMVGIEGGKIVGSAQSFCRHINPPAEQILLIQHSGTPTQYFPHNGETIVETKPIEAPEKHSCAPPTYGCITLVHNYCSVPVNFTALGLDKTNAILSKSRKMPTPDTSLTFVYMFPDGRLTSGTTKVLDFKKCEDHFDPEKVYLVDKDEQFCTKEINNDLGNDPIDLPAALLFSYEGDKWHFVGIESKAGDGVSLVTFAPYHCKDFETACSD